MTELVLQEELAQLTPEELRRFIRQQWNIGHRLPFNSHMTTKSFDILAQVMLKYYSPGDAIARVFAAKGK
jgi:hypothetical protein